MPFAAKIAANSSKVITKSTSLRTEVRDASSFLAAQGPAKTIFPSGCLCLIIRAVATIGVRALDTVSTISGRVLLARTDQAGQQDVRRNGFLPLFTSFTYCFASVLAPISAPSATSYTSANPTSFKAALIFHSRTSAPNCPMTAGASST